MNHPFTAMTRMRDGAPRGPALEAARLDALLGLLGQPRFSALLGLLIEDCRERPGRIRTCHARGDRAGLRAEAARLSRAAVSIGAMRLGDVSSSLIDLCDLAPAVPLIEALDEAARATLSAARHLLGEQLALADSV